MKNWSRLRRKDAGPAENLDSQPALMTPVVSADARDMPRLSMSWPLALLGVLAVVGCSGQATDASRPRDAAASQSEHQRFPLAAPGQNVVTMTACLHRGGVHVDPVPAAFAGHMSSVSVSMGIHGGSTITFFATPAVAERFVIASGSFAGRVHRVGVVTFDLTGIRRVDRVIAECAVSLSGHLS
jgi:hypothetical protein